MNIKKNLIIPMAGAGKRFKLAGYNTYKPFIKINKKYMVDYVLEAFPKEVKKHIITSKNLLSKSQIKYLKDKKCNIIFIAPHSKGPAYSIYKAKNKLPLSEAFFISYVDIAWVWNWKKIQPLLDEEGIIFVHRGFHPHLIENNYSAFCKKTSNDRLIEIKEKGSFTSNHLKEDLSIGLFYVKSGHDMISGIDHIIIKDIRAGNEYFPSLIFNQLTKESKSISLLKVDTFIHWGVPEQLEDFFYWQNTIKLLDEKQYSKKKFDTIMTMAGFGERMKEISDKTKALINVKSLPMYKFTYKFFPAKNKYIIVTNLIKKQIKQDNKTFCYVLPKKTNSQFETIQMSNKIFKGKTNFFLISCDAFSLFDKKKFCKFVLSKKADVIIFTFHPTLTQAKLSKQHTHISSKLDKVTKIHIKSKSSEKDLGLAGFFWIKCGNTFNSVVEKIIPSNYSEEVVADHVIKKYIDLGYTVAQFQLDNYLHIGTKNEFLEFKYWLDRKNAFA